MRALVFGVPPEPFEAPEDANQLAKNLGCTPVALQEVADPQLLHDDWVITRPRLTGICGSDSKQILLDFGESDTDNAMAAFCSFPQVMGHEVVADVVYDTVGKPETFEVGARVLISRGTLVQAGVHAPGRWEWSPLYFKEISWVGSNAFGVEEVDGQRKHAIAHYLDMVVRGRIDLRPMLTHTFGLAQWRDAFLAIANQGETGAVKVAIDQR